MKFNAKPSPFLFFHDAKENIHVFATTQNYFFTQFMKYSPSLCGFISRTVKRPWHIKKKLLQYNN